MDTYITVVDSICGEDTTIDGSLISGATLFAMFSVTVRVLQTTLRKFFSDVMVKWSTPNRFEDDIPNICGGQFTNSG